MPSVYHVQTVAHWRQARTKAAPRVRRPAPWSISGGPQRGVSGSTTIFHFTDPSTNGRVCIRPLMAQDSFWRGVECSMRNGRYPRTYNQSWVSYQSTSVSHDVYTHSHDVLRSGDPHQIQTNSSADIRWWRGMRRGEAVCSAALYRSACTNNLPRLPQALWSKSDCRCAAHGGHRRHARSQAIVRVAKQSSCVACAADFDLRECTE